MSDPPTPLSLPPSLPYPITITRLLVQRGAAVKRGSHLLEYSFMSKAQREAIDRRAKEGRKADLTRGEVEGNDGSGTWDCLVDGEVVDWEDGVRVGMVIERRQASRPLLTVSQPCSHPVQSHGMCGICGADLTEDDYLSAPPPAASLNQAGPSRHPGGFEITHDAMGVTVSKNEAQRLDNLTRDALLATRRLSLIVDLDQTIIHTTVDPTVAEWMDEIEADRRANEAEAEAAVAGVGVDGSSNHTQAAEVTPKPSSPPYGISETTPPVSPKSVERSTTPPTSPHRASVTLPNISPPKPTSSHREKNPNAEALGDVARFQIADDLPPGYVKPKKRPGQKDMVNVQGRWYFTKPRPGLDKFLTEMSKYYEMHVYTMGTRTYADAICKVIDPDGKVFGGRILSRDESGSFSSKNLKRLFPTDTSMVVVIDDRSDVWGDCPNLVKVVPYDFFIGIGDINSSFLPSNNKSPPPPSSAAASPALAPATTSAANPSSPISDASTPPPTTPADETSVEDELLLKTKLLDELSESRPLAKMQQQLEVDGDDAGPNVTETATSGSQIETKGNDSIDQSAAKSKSDNVVVMSQPAERSTTPPQSPARPRKPLLNPHDYELLRVSNILHEIHHRFYTAYDGLEEWDPKTALPMNCDVEFIIPELKARVLDGCNLVFSGLIPQLVNPATTDIWQTAETFGALCAMSVHPKVTHCVTATLNTEKTYYASKIPGAKIVWSNWFWDSVALWKRQPEVKYIAGKENESGSASRRSTPLSRTPTAGGRDPTNDDGVGGKSRDLNDRPNGKTSGNIYRTTDDNEGGPSGRSQGADADANADEHEDMSDDAAVGAGWDEGADKEWEDFMAEDDDDFNTDAGSVKSADSTPSTPSKKRVRYADEESLPLEDFKDPSPPHPDDPPNKRRKPLLLEGPSADDVIPEMNRLQYIPLGAYRSKRKGKAKADGQSERSLDEATVDKDDERKGLGAVESDETGADTGSADQSFEERQALGDSEGGGDDEDEFAMMLMDSLADGGGDKEGEE